MGLRNTKEHKMHTKCQWKIISSLAIVSERETGANQAII